MTERTPFAALSSPLTFLVWLFPEIQGHCRIIIEILLFVFLLGLFIQCNYNDFELCVERINWWNHPNWTD